MTSMSAYKGLELAPSPSEAGGQALNDNFTHIVDWRPKSEWSKTAAPAATDDVDGDYYVGSLWLDTSTGKLYLCTDNANDAAKWQLFPFLVADDNPPKLSGDLDVNGNDIVSSSNGDINLVPDGSGEVGVGTSSPECKLHVKGTVKLEDLPTSDPSSAGAVWNDSGTLKISSGS